LHTVPLISYSAPSLSVDETSEIAKVAVYAIRGMSDPSFKDLRRDTRFVHIVGRPTTWVVKLILKKAPRVEVIEIAPGWKGELVPRTREICKGKVKFQIGYKTEPRPHYRRQQAYFLSLLRDEKKRRLFDELIMIGIQDAVIAGRYFGLNGEVFASLAQIAREFDLVTNTVCHKINAVLHYLDDSFDVSGRAKMAVRGIENRVNRFRKEKDEEQNKRLREQYAKLLGVEPVNQATALGYIRRDRMKIFRLLWLVGVDVLELLRQDAPRSYTAIAYGFGLVDGAFHTQERTAVYMQITKQAVSELQTRAVLFLREFQRSIL